MKMRDYSFQGFITERALRVAEYRCKITEISARMCRVLDRRMGWSHRKRQSGYAGFWRWKRRQRQRQQGRRMKRFRGF